MSEKERIIKELRILDDGDIEDSFERMAQFVLSDRRKMLDEIEAILDRSYWVVDVNGALTKRDAVRLAKDKIHELRKG